MQPIHPGWVGRARQGQGEHETRWDRGLEGNDRCPSNITAISSDAPVTHHSPLLPWGKGTKEGIVVPI